MSLFAKRGPRGGLPSYPPRIACFVCGREVPADYPLYPEPPAPATSSSSSASIPNPCTPFFPFLLYHLPPPGCRPPSPGGAAMACSMCYATLMRQWEDYQSTGVPLEQRVYWLDRLEGRPATQLQQHPAHLTTHLGHVPHATSPLAQVPNSLAATIALPGPKARSRSARLTPGTRASTSTPSPSPAPAHASTRAPSTHASTPSPAHTPTPSLTSVPSSAAATMATTTPSTTATASSPCATIVGPPSLLRCSGRPPPPHSPWTNAHSSVQMALSIPLSLANALQTGQVPPPSSLTTMTGMGGRSSASPCASTSVCSVPGSVVPPSQASGVDRGESLAAVSCSSPRPPMTNEPPDTALDLSSGARDRDQQNKLHTSSGKDRPHQERETLRSRSSATSHLSAGSHHSESATSMSSSATGAATVASGSANNGTMAIDMLDLTLPDKNAWFEVCYVCGDDFKRGSLTHVFAKPSSPDRPFFASLTCHARPPRSRPMDAFGRVLACAECVAHLKQQWLQFEASDTSHTDRHYLLRKRALPPSDSAAFVCYLCSLEYPSSSLRLLYSRPNPENELYYPFIELQKPPPGASPVSPQGMVQVCSLCAKATREKHHGFSGAERPPLKKRRGDGRVFIQAAPHFDLVCDGAPEARDKNSRPQCSFDNDLEDTDEGERMFPADLTCPLCRRRFSAGSFRLLHSRPPPDGGVPFYPFLADLPRGEDYLDGSHGARQDKQDRVGACQACTTELLNQWTVFQREQVPPEQRYYVSNSPTGPRTWQCKTDGTSGGVVGNSLHVESMCRTRSPPCASSRIADSKCSSGNASSFYCFLCGLHSELTFSRMLYSSAPGKKAPYFPFMKKHVPKSRAEALREDGTALVCTFCYHSVMMQWSRYNESKSPHVDPSSRTYNLNDYKCYVCGVTTYRKRIRALRVVDFPFLRHHKPRKGVITMENGEMVAVCLDCFENLHNQFMEGAKYGIPVDKRQYNWIQVPPPPEDLAQHHHLSGPRDGRMSKVNQDPVSCS